MREKPLTADPELAPALKDRGLLHILEPETLVDKATTERLTTVLVDLITSGAFDTLQRDGVEFHELSYSRLGYMGDAGLAEMVYDELIRHGLARPSKDGVSIPLHPMVRRRTARPVGRGATRA